MQPHEVEEQLKKIRTNEDRIIELLEQISVQLNEIANRVGA